MEEYKITRPGQTYEEPHIGRRLPKKLDTHRWRVLRHSLDNDPQPETYDVVVAAKTVTPST